MFETFNFLTRHSKKFKKDVKDSKESVEYPGLTQEGVELARQKAVNEIRSLVDELPERSILAIIGVSEAVRAKSTAEIYGDKLKKVYQDDQDVVVRTKKEISEQEKAIDGLKMEMKQNPDKKFVLDFPLFIKEFSLINRWLDKDGKPVPYEQKLMEAVNNDPDQAVIKWVETDGEIDGVKGAKPLEVAQAYKKGFERLKNFVEGQTSDRPVFIGGVGHSWIWTFSSLI